MNSIREDILDIVLGSGNDLTPAELQNRLFHESALTKAQVRAAIRVLVEDGLLGYSCRHGHTVVERSFSKPVRISKGIVVKPPRVSFAAEPNDVVIEIASGAAFGSGIHPTTRIALRGLEFLFKEAPYEKKKAHTAALDIGTGSGILAIAALHFGVSFAVGTDIDPCARCEAVENAAKNGFDGRFVVLDTPVEDISDHFDPIIANLRTPTLLRIGSKLSQICKASGAVVLSGIRIEESKTVCRAYESFRFENAWYAEEQQWCGFVFLERSGSSHAKLAPVK
ncbi:MAG: hypothetical protein C4530_04310 [Desulfobacteraceae bacterium]|nr:MAG: hypothetical protein C4530_04310 [Desulfobacteraceae bacterium]